MAADIISDKLAREKIKNDVSKNFFVEAGAGSGKTFSLVQRMVSMVKSGIEIGKICAITFTKAAAGEFYSRFYKALNEEINNASGEEYENIKNAIDNFDTCFMGTLDSFCSMVIAEHPIEAGVPADSKVVDDTEIQSLYVQELSKIANGDYGEELKNKFLVFKSVNRNYKKAFSKCIGFMAEKRTAEFVLFDSADILSSATSKLNKIKGIASWIEENNLIPYEGRKPSAESAKLFREKSHLLGVDIKENFIDIDRFISKLNKFSFSNTADLGQYTDYFCDDAKKTKTLDVSEIQQCLKRYKYAVTLDFAASALDAISKELKKKGKLTFFDYKLYLRDMLKDDAQKGCKLINHIYNRHSYYLIDEFQDTNPLQYEIVFYLAAGKDAVPQWDMCFPKPGSLFIVGDPKQSIYRFQGADIESFNKVKSLFDSGIIGETLILTKNFRSTEIIGNWFNKTFEDEIIFPHSVTKYQCGYSSIPADEMRKVDGEFSGIYIYKTEQKSRKKDAPQKASDPENVCNIIKKLVFNSKYKVVHSRGENPSEITYGDIMVITKNKNSISKYTDEFTRNGIPSFAEGKIDFNNSEALSLVSKLLNVVADPNDKISLYQILTSKVFAVSEKEIYAYTYNGRAALQINSVKSVEGCEKLAAALTALSKLRQKANLLSPVAAIEMLADEIKVLTLGGADYYECFIQARELLREAESANSVLTIKEAAEYLDKIITGISGQERCLSLNQNNNAVRVANLHKVKGLEAPVVILATAEKKDYNPEYHIAFDGSTKKCYINCISGDFFNSRMIDSDNLYINEIEEEKNFSEWEYKRLLYVAATRARNILVIGQEYKENELVESSYWNPLAGYNLENFADCITGELKEAKEIKAYTAEELYQKSEEEAVMNRTTSLKKSYELHLPSKEDGKKKSTVFEEEQSDENGRKDEIVKPNDGLDAALKGTLVHALMELIVSSEKDADIEYISEALCRTYNADDRYLAKLVDVGKTIYNGGYEQSNDLDKDILKTVRDKSVSEKHCEVPFCYMKNGIMVNGVMDLLICIDDKWHIIDYKTDSDKEASYTAHTAQLEEYKKALKEIYGIDAEAHIYHICT